MHSLDGTVSDKIVIYVLSHIDIGKVKRGCCSVYVVLLLSSVADFPGTQ